MKVALITPWENVWVPMYRAEFEKRGHEFIVCKHQAPKDTDMVLHGWCNQTVIHPTARNVVFLRRYELFSGGLGTIDWSKVSDLIFVNSWIKTMAEDILRQNNVTVRTHLIYNSVIESKWTFKDRK